MLTLKLPLALAVILAIPLGANALASQVNGAETAELFRPISHLIGARAKRTREREAARVTITRDDWGIAHIYGKTDADAVFGMIYAQAEDDFNRIESNYLTAMGRLAEAERYSTGDLRDVYFYPDQLIGHTERQYHPGS